MALELRSSAFTDRGEIPRDYTCDGADGVPPLEWRNVPSGTKSLALIVDDPDAPDPKAPKMTYVHWVVYDIPPAARGLTGDGDALPHGAREGLNDWKRTGWGGPCPPIGRHRYFFKLHALDTTLGDLGAKATKADVEKAMQGHVLERAEIMGTYQRG